MISKKTLRNRVAPKAAAAALSGLLLCSCGQMTTPLPTQLPIVEQLQSGTDAQKHGDITRLTVISGKLNRCIGKRTCDVDIHVGDILFIMRFMPEKNGAMEVSIADIGHHGIVLKQEFDFFMEDKQTYFQTIGFGEKTRIDHTDLEIEVIKNRNFETSIKLRPVDAASSE
ncbi:MAG: hypothetical protein ABH983_01165 [Candidatus Micrarchaeota archaeon]|nr:hypothetical protein [Candidatus Micrarchaeota archaeon]MBU1681200.1 hypothetical protein [Candidatus Micrarchaeota archaeon]